MNVYLDTGVVLRALLDHPQRLSAWGQWDSAYSSELLGVECRRLIDRLRLEKLLDGQALAETIEQLAKIEKTITRIRMTTSIIQAASRTMPTIVNTFDAFHLASAIAVRDRRGVDLLFATHDSQQADAARALGFSCLEA